MMKLRSHVCLLAMVVAFARANPMHLAYAVNVDWPHAHCEVKYTVSGVEEMPM